MGGAGSSPSTPTVRRATLAVAVGGLVLQAVVNADPLRTATYFTVWSVALLAAALLLGPRLRAVRALVEGAAVVGVALSALVYWALIAPREGPRWLLDEPVAALASLLVHGATPLLAVAGYLALAASGGAEVGARAGAAGPARGALVLVLWPLLWFGAITAAVGAGLTPMPYAFLDAARAGSGPVVAVLVAAGGLAWVGGVLLLRAANRAARRRQI